MHLLVSCGAGMRVGALALGGAAVEVLLHCRDQVEFEGATP